MNDELCPICGAYWDCDCTGPEHTNADDSTAEFLDTWPAAIAVEAELMKRNTAPLFPPEIRGAA